jgi:hypothetical protein
MLDEGMPEIDGPEVIRGVCAHETAALIERTGASYAER